MISVIIPAFNSEKYLMQCVDSIVTDRRQEAEIILVDDGSNDATPSLCDALAEKYFPVITVLHKENGGVQTARNLGYSKAKGEWIWFVDSDDVVALGALRKLSEAIKKTSSDAIYFGVSTFEEDRLPDWASNDCLTTEIVAAEDFLSGTYSQKYSHYLWEYVFRKEILEKMSHQRQSGSVGPCIEEYSFLDDLVFTEEFLRFAETVEVIPDVLYGYRQVSSSITHACSPQAADSALRAIRSIDAFQVGHKDQVPKALMQIGLLFNAYRVAGVDEGSTGLRKEIAGEISDRVRAVGLFRLSPRLLVRYAALLTGVGNIVLQRRGNRR